MQEVSDCEVLEQLRRPRVWLSHHRLPASLRQPPNHHKKLPRKQEKVLKNLKKLPNYQQPAPLRQPPNHHKKLPKKRTKKCLKNLKKLPNHQLPAPFRQPPNYHKKLPKKSKKKCQKNLKNYSTTNYQLLSGKLQIITQKISKKVRKSKKKC